MANYSSAALFVAALAAASSRSDAFIAPIASPRTCLSGFPSSNHQLSSSKTENEGAVATAVAAQPKDAVPDFSSSTKPMDESKIFNDNKDDVGTTWQENLEALLAPDTAVAKRQIVLSDLLNAAPEIQESVKTALRERKVSDLNFLFSSHTYIKCVTHLSFFVRCRRFHQDRWITHANSKEIARGNEGSCKTNYI